MEFLLNKCLAMKISDTFPIDEAVYQLLSSNEKVYTMISRINELARPNASMDLCNFINNLTPAQWYIDDQPEARTSAK